MEPTSTLLVFPAGVDGAKEYLHIARQLGVRTVAASSVPLAPDVADGDVSIHLPYVTDPAFRSALRTALAQYRVTHVYAPHHAVWSILKWWQAQPDAPAFTLCGNHAHAEHWERFSTHLKWAASMGRDSLADAIGSSPAPALDDLNHAALCQGFLRVPGECDLDKLRSLCAIARHLPRGEVVEIGTLYGRSAYALARLARHYRIGSTICIDPWRSGEIEAQGPSARSADRGDGRPSGLERIFLQFQTMAMEMPGLGYLRATSANAVPLYQEAAERGMLESPGLDAVPVTGRMALLHIDGNHRYDHVVQDIALWSYHLAPGGWLLLDDYCWAFGDGPRRAGDELLMTGDYDTAFVAADTLFLRRTMAP